MLSKELYTVPSRRFWKKDSRIRSNSIGQQQYVLEMIQKIPRYGSRRIVI